MSEFAKLIAIGKYDLSYKFLDHGKPVKEGEKITILSIHKSGLENEDRKKALNALERMSIVIEYSSMYDEKFKETIDFRKLLSQVDITKLIL